MISGDCSTIASRCRLASLAPGRCYRPRRHATHSRPLRPPCPRRRCRLRLCRARHPRPPSRRPSCPRRASPARDAARGDGHRLELDEHLRGPLPGLLRLRVRQVREEHRHPRRIARRGVRRKPSRRRTRTSCARRSTRRRPAPAPIRCSRRWRLLRRLHRRGGCRARRHRAAQAAARGGRPRARREVPRRGGHHAARGERLPALRRGADAGLQGRDARHRGPRPGRHRAAGPRLLPQGRRQHEGGARVLHRPRRPDARALRDRPASKGGGRRTSFASRPRSRSSSRTR